jgi:hypothetical protein
MKRESPCLPSGKGDAVWGPPHVNTKNQERRKKEVQNPSTPIG